MRICTADKATRRRTDNYAIAAVTWNIWHLQIVRRLEAEGVCQDTVTGWITPQSPFKATDLLGSPSQCEAGHVVMGGHAEC